MNTHLPTLILNTLSPSSQLFSSTSWKKAQLLCLGAILCQGARRISSILNLMGMVHNKGFGKYHGFLNRDEWNPLIGAKILLGLLVSLIPSNQTLMIVFDDTVERRKGRIIKAKGCYRDLAHIGRFFKLIIKRPEGRTHSFLTLNMEWDR